ncbi:MAG: DUF87 domain-containing protein [Thermoplasmata archaeon]
MGKIIFGKRHFITNEKYYMPIIVDELPKTVTFGIMNNFLSSKERWEISMHIFPLEDDTVMEILDSDNEKLNAEISQEKIFSSKYRKISRKLESVKEVQEYIISGKGHIYEFSMIFFSKGKNFYESEKYHQTLLHELKKHMFKFYMPYYRQENAFMNLIPGLKGKIEKSHFLHTHALGVFFPFLQDYIEMEGGIFYGINERNNSPVIFNRWEYPSSHYIISGTTGFGKSYFVKLMVLREVINDPNLRVYILDPMGEYSSLAKLLNGTVVKVGERGYEINPLDLNDIKSFREKIARLRHIFSIIIEMDRNELSLIDSSLTKLYKKRENPKISDLLEIIKEENEIGIYTTMERIFSGSLKYLDSYTSINLDKKIISFDLSKLSDEYLTLYMAIILDHIYGKISRDYEKKLVIVDEAWKLLKNEYSAIFLDSMFRHVRRWKCGMNVISQKMDDFLDNPFGRSMANNSLMHVIFKHSIITESMKKFYNLNEIEIEYIMNAEKPKKGKYSQAYFITHPLRFPLRVIATEEENKFITTDPDELKSLYSSLERLI